jgi:lipoate-protein ligase B
LLVVDLGVMEYAAALALQRRAASARIRGDLSDDLLLLVEHPPVITLGRSSEQAHLLLDANTLAVRGVRLFDVERGGDVTFHGPGQLVGYPIIDLRQHREDLHWYLRRLEETLVIALRGLGVHAEASPGLTGVWTDGRKIASIGVHAKQWITWHGFALNVTTDLSFFDLIVPCGIAGVEMTSVARELRLVPGDDTRDTLDLTAKRAVVDAFVQVFGLAPYTTSVDSLRPFLDAGVE